MAEAVAFIKGVGSFRCQHDGSWLTSHMTGTESLTESEGSLGFC